jgi:CRISPR-associated protein Cas1
VRVHDLHSLPTTADGWSHLYVERCRIDQQDSGIALHDQRGMVRVPCAMVSCLLVGPGVSITSAAMRTLAAHGCSVVWVGEEGVRFYAASLGETRSSRRLLHQARCFASPSVRLEVAVRMYRMRFEDPPPSDASIAQLRGMEGARVRKVYADAAREYGVEWKGRNYDRKQWGASDAINRALSSASACLYGVCHAAIVAAGYSPGIGFIHTGRMLSFVYDIADLYKSEVAVPAAFAAVAKGEADLDARVRRYCREAFYAAKILKRIVGDIGDVLTVSIPDDELIDGADFAPGELWDGGAGTVQGGANHA